MYVAMCTLVDLPAHSWPPTLPSTPLPRSFVRLDCRHAFCQGCLGEQCSIHVREGGLDALKCPEPKCGAALSPQVGRL